MIMNMEDNISVIKGIGEKTEKLFNKLGIVTVGDLIEYYPRNYDTYKPIVEFHYPYDLLPARNLLVL